MKVLPYTYVCSCMSAVCVGCVLCTTVVVCTFVRRYSIFAAVYCSVVVLPEVQYLRYVPSIWKNEGNSVRLGTVASLLGFELSKHGSRTDDGSGIACGVEGTRFIYNRGQICPACSASGRAKLCTQFWCASRIPAAICGN